MRQKIFCTSRNSTGFVTQGPVIFFFAAMLYIYIFSLPPLPFHEDELFFLDKAIMFQGNVYDFASDSFAQYRFYRILGRPLNFFAYAVAGRHPVLLTAVVMITVCLLLYVFSRMIASFFASRYTYLSTTLLFIILAIPFSYYLILLRVVYHELATMALIALCFWLIKKIPTGCNQIYWAAGIAALYTLSLFVYESSFLMPLLFVSILLLGTDRQRFYSRSLMVLSGFLVFGGFFYLVMQFYYLPHQPKLSESMSIYAPYSIGLSYAEQFLRILLYGLYHLKWSFFTLFHKGTALAPLDYLIIFAALIFAGYSFWKLLSIKEAYVPQEKVFAAIIMGIVFFFSTFGLWGYYWLFKKTIVFPPFYTMLLPSIAIGLTTVGALSVYAKYIIVSKSLRIIITLFFLSLLAINAVLVLSSRLAIAKTANEMEQYAKSLNRQFGSSANSYRNLILLDLPPDTFYARKKARYGSLLLFYLNQINDHWENISMISNAIKFSRERNSLVALPQNRILMPEETLIVTYIGGGSFQILNNMQAQSVVSSMHEPVDPYKVSLFNYELFYSTERANIILKKCNRKETSQMSGQ